MNKTEVVTRVAEKTGMAEEVCRKVMDALEQISGNALLARMKGIRVDEAGTVAEVAERSDVPEADCKAVLTAFEETFGEAISDKFRFFKK